MFLLISEEREIFWYRLAPFCCSDPANPPNLKSEKAK